MNDMQRRVIIYHARCADGFGAAWALHRWARHGPGTIAFLPMSYGEKIDTNLLAGAFVWIVDFSFPRDVMRKIAGAARGVTLLDHHKKAIDELDGLSLPGLRMVLDAKRSGAGIAWDYVLGARGRPRPNLINYVEDRDLWRFRLPHSREVNEWIQSLDHDMTTWDMADRELENVPAFMGKWGDHIAGMIKKQDIIIGCVVRDAVPMSMIPGAVGVNSPMLKSEIGHAIVEGGADIALVWHVEKGIVHCSLRSGSDGPDVNDIAKEFGGGGHRNAAGFRTSFAAFVKANY